jgi:hypothetical protein
MIKKQFTLYLENKPGALARITARLARAGVNIEGISVASSTEVALAQLVVSNASVTRRALKEAKAAFTMQEVALVKLGNKPGELARITSKLAKAKVNINYVYATACDCGASCHCYAIISAPDLSRVEAVWKS